MRWMAPREFVADKSRCRPALALFCASSLMMPEDSEQREYPSPAGLAHSLVQSLRLPQGAMAFAGANMIYPPLGHIRPGKGSVRWFPNNVGA